MSTDAGADRQQMKMREFMSLLPLTLEIAGLARAEVGRHFNEGQMEVRANTIKLAYKVARQLVIEAAKDGK
jgi:macrodomain Ter protein organizer (MatP/YcbG family)